MPDHVYTAVSLFSGAMGLDLGLEASGRFRILACVEKERTFCDTIELNKREGRLDPNLHIFHRDIAHVRPEEILAATGLQPGELDLLVGGPPCQTFSTAGRRGTLQDPRGTLIWQFIRFVEVLQPKFFLMENVRGLLSAAIKHRPLAQRPNKGGPPLSPLEQPGSVVRMFADDLQRMQTPYHVDCFEVNAVNYGAPQLRERVLFIGNRYNAVVDFPQPTHGPDTHDLLPRQPWKTLGEALRGVADPGPVLLDFSPRKKRYLSLVPPGGNWRSLPEDVQKESMGAAWYAKGGRSGWWRRLSMDLPCPTLVTLPNHASTSLCHPSEVRALSLKEYACIQEFPSNWEFCGTPAEQYAQAGNAVPVRLGNVAGNVIAKEADRLRVRDWESYPGTPEYYRVIYIQSHVRTRNWYRNGAAVASDSTLTERAYTAPRTLWKTRQLAERPLSA